MEAKPRVVGADVARFIIDRANKTPWCCKCQPQAAEAKEGMEDILQTYLIAFNREQV